MLVEWAVATAAADRETTAVLLRTRAGAMPAAGAMQAMVAATPDAADAETMAISLERMPGAAGAEGAAMAGPVSAATTTMTRHRPEAVDEAAGPGRTVPSSTG